MRRHWTAYLLLVVVATCLSCGRRPQPTGPGAQVLPTEMHGLVASIHSLGGDALTAGQPLRLEYTLTNKTDGPLAISGVASRVQPEFDLRECGCMGGGPLDSPPRIELAPGQSVSRWVEVALRPPTKGNLFRAGLRCEGNGGGTEFFSNSSPRTVRFRLTFRTAYVNEDPHAAFATPWIDLRVLDSATPARRKLPAVAIGLAAIIAVFAIWWRRRRPSARAHPDDADRAGA